MGAGRLHPDDLTALVDGTARRVVELLREKGAAPAETPVLLSAAQVAARFGVSRDWVYEHADELGALRLGAGRKPRLRFDAERVATALTPRQGSMGPAEPDAPPRLARQRQVPRPTPTECPLLPIGGG